MHGVVNLDKPAGLSSQQAVTRVKRALPGVRKAGHAGTLDPLATGVLLVCVGEATKVSRFLMDLGKTYTAEMRFGFSTTTYDSEGEVLESAVGIPPDAKSIEGALDSFRGEIMQVPPMYSALKRGGVALYTLAREGVEVEREARPVTVHELDLVAYEPPFARIRVRCTKGTYIRSLVHDLAISLGSRAHMTALRRDAVGGFRAENAAGIDDIGPASVMPLDIALAHLPELVLDADDSRRASNGMATGSAKYPTPAGGPDYLRLKDNEGRLFAIARLENGLIKIDRILNTREGILN